MGDSKTPDLRSGIAFTDLADGEILHGSVDSEEVLLLRRGSACFAVGALCTHYHAPLGKRPSPR